MGHSITRRQRLYDSTGGRCWYCGVEVNPFTFHADHVIPKALGGAGMSNNLVSACPSCNSSKGCRDLEVWRDALARRNAGWPVFSPSQIAWLREVGANLPEIPDHVFFYEKEGLV